MVRQITDTIYCIEIELKGTPLKELNAYYIKGQDRSLLIDTGFRTDSCREALTAGLRELSSNSSRLDVLATHMHADHLGLAGEVCPADGKIYLHEADLALGREHTANRFFSLCDPIAEKNGFPVGLLEDRKKTARSLMDFNDPRFTPLKDGDVLFYGGNRLELIHCPGHTPGNSMLYVREQKLMFTGDHILFGITPNISFMTDGRDALGIYMESLEKVRSLPVETALPGHREGGDYALRIQSLLEHHDRRLKEAESLVKNQPGLTAYELTKQMHWRIRAESFEDFPVMQKWFAFAEGLSHLEHLAALGRIHRREEEDGRLIFLP